MAFGSSHLLSILGGNKRLDSIGMARYGYVLICDASQWKCTTWYIKIEYRVRFGNAIHKDAQYCIGTVEFGPDMNCAVSVR